MGWSIGRICRSTNSGFFLLRKKECRLFLFFIRAGKEKEPLTQPLLGVLILQLHVENLVLQPCLRPSMGVDFSGTKNTTFLVGGGNSS